MSQPNPHQQIQVDTSDDDSLFETKSCVGSNLSFASSVRDYCYENGRRYHAYRHGQYPFPNDEEEQDRLALVHQLFKLISGGDLYRAPIRPRDEPQEQTPLPRRILDIGTGTAEWALEIAEDFPTAEIIGTDLSPIQPNWAPPNCRFYIDDAESDWTFAPGEAFDYIHARSLNGGIGDWPRLLRQSFQHLRPGGWVEIQEFETLLTSDDNTHQHAPAVMEWLERLNVASKQFGKQINIATHIRPWMEAEGFANVTDDIYKCPIGGWAKDRRLKEIGRLGKLTVMEVVEPYTLALFTRVLGFTFQEAQEHMEKVRAELMNTKIHLYVLFHFIYGQRPVDETNGSSSDTPT
ncbi:uncharacterized protein N7483_010816 [Penicillium malachiteum]|uniref:uncharacterized protein n=1 Tax=Penicillium malachiteum TaxID=1324776 RepID=UPI0025493701|nr:uncharacterized protein N7483_010816 [Penicillium malachiteum]KAJ5713635.1 hypothetical protein N7483_010816 [Penicillium malachiteum]